MKHLVKKAMAGNKDAFVQLMEMNTQSMYKVARAYFTSDADVADAISETVLICFEQLDTLRKPEYFKTWMTRILINHCYDILRERSDYVDLDCCEEPAQCDEYNIEFKEALSSVDERYRLPMELYYGQGFKVKEIAEILSMPPNTIKTYLSRGRKQIAKYYGKEL